MLYTTTMSCLVEADNAEQAALKATTVHRDLSNYFVEVVSPSGTDVWIFTVQETTKATLAEEVRRVLRPADSE